MFGRGTAKSGSECLIRRLPYPWMTPVCMCCLLRQGDIPKDDDTIQYATATHLRKIVDRCLYKVSGRAERCQLSDPSEADCRTCSLSLAFCY